MPAYRPDAALIVQSDGTILAEVAAPDYPAARGKLARFAELEKSPEHVHTYRVTPLSLWNAAASGMSAEEIVAALEAHSKYDLPSNVLTHVREQLGRYGRVRIESGGASGALRLVTADALLAEALSRSKAAPLFGPRLEPTVFELPVLARGEVKQALLRLGWPVDDRAGFEAGEPLAVALRGETRRGSPFAVRPYQDEAAEVFLAGGAHGVVALPCGAGKTVVGMAAMARVAESTLILCSSTTAARQWIAELLDKTTLRAEDVGEYSGDTKEVRPVTVATYQILTHRPGARRRAHAAQDLSPADYPHFSLFTARAWGLVVYDEVHLLPAPVFRMTAVIQARRRLGLTATLVREDGREGDVFSLVGPKRYDVPWKEMERNGFIAGASCREIRVALGHDERAAWSAAEPRARHRLAAENSRKLDVVRHLARRHAGEPTLVIGTYLGQLEKIAQALDAPLVTGETPQPRREALYREFRDGRHPVLVLSKVGNFSIDLPDASVCIQVSGAFGSRQEEAQRLGRILRPKEREACFYSLVSRETEEQELAMNRQLFLAEQGYRYYVDDWTGEAEAGESPERAAGEVGGAAVISMAEARARRGEAER
jgi:DNA excision repair protein ERCC-3